MFAKPAVGQVVSVTTQYGEQKNVYENLPVLKSEKWDDPNTFRIPAVNEPYITQRVITLKSVVHLEVNGNAGDQQNVETGVKVYILKGSKGNEYTVTQTGDNYSCTCPHHVYRRATCKHITAVINGDVKPLTSNTKNGMFRASTDTKRGDKPLINPKRKEKMTMSSENLSWGQRFALIETYKPDDTVICTAFGVSAEELSTAREMLADGTFSVDTSFDTKPFASHFAKPGHKEPVEPITTSTAPRSATKRETPKKPRGRQGSNIVNAFTKVPSEPTPVETFARENNVSVAVLRQAKRFDKSGVEGVVRVKKDKETKTLMIWRETAE